MRKLWIVQPYLPRYRVLFFERLAEKLDAEGIELNVVSGTPGKTQRLRGDATKPEWLHVVEGRHLRMAGRSLTLTSTRSLWKGSDAVILPLMGSSIDALNAAAFPRGIKVGFWGHVAPYTSPPNSLDLAIERWQMRRAQQVFAYTEGGRRFAVRSGIPSEKITVLNNTTDSIGLRDEIASLLPEDIQEFRTRHRIPNGPLVAYLGGLDGPKRVDDLADVTKYWSKNGSSFHLVVAGEGAHSGLLDDAERSGFVTRIGHVDGQEKALLLKASFAILNPGLIGLLAIDALVAGLPVVTMKEAIHGPEAEYLVEGESRFTIDGGSSFLAEFIESMAVRAPESDVTAWSFPTLESMVDNFSNGVKKMFV